MNEIKRDDFSRKESQNLSNKNLNKGEKTKVDLKSKHHFDNLHSNTMLIDNTSNKITNNVQNNSCRNDSSCTPLNEIPNVLCHSSIANNSLTKALNSCSKDCDSYIGQQKSVLNIDSLEDLINKKLKNSNRVKTTLENVLEAANNIENYIKMNNLNAPFVCNNFSSFQIPKKIDCKLLSKNTEKSKSNPTFCLNYSNNFNLTNSSEGQIVKTNKIYGCSESEEFKNNAKSELLLNTPSKIIEKPKLKHKNYINIDDSQNTDNLNYIKNVNKESNIKSKEELILNNDLNLNENTTSINTVG